MVFSFGMGSPTNASAHLPDSDSKYSTLKLPKPDQEKGKQFGTKSNASIEQSQSSSQKVISPFESARNGDETTPHNRGNATKSILKNKSSSRRSPSRVENGETADLMLKLTI
jgi:hypothetical protein